MSDARKKMQDSKTELPKNSSNQTLLTQETWPVGSDYSLAEQNVRENTFHTVCFIFSGRWLVRGFDERNRFIIFDCKQEKKLFYGEPSFEFCRPFLENTRFRFFYLTNVLCGLLIDGHGIVIFNPAEFSKPRFILDFSQLDQNLFDLTRITGAVAFPLMENYVAICGSNDEDIHAVYLVDMQKKQCRQIFKNSEPFVQCRVAISSMRQLTILNFNKSRFINHCIYNINFATLEGSLERSFVTFFKEDEDSIDDVEYSISPVNAEYFCTGSKVFRCLGEKQIECVFSADKTRYFLDWLPNGSALFVSTDDQGNWLPGEKQKRSYYQINFNESITMTSFSSLGEAARVGSDLRSIVDPFDGSIIEMNQTNCTRYQIPNVLDYWLARIKQELFGFLGLHCQYLGPNELLEIIASFAVSVDPVTIRQVNSSFPWRSDIDNETQMQIRQLHLRFSQVDDTKTTTASVGHFNTHQQRRAWRFFVSLLQDENKSWSVCVSEALSSIFNEDIRLFSRTVPVLAGEIVQIDLMSDLNINRALLS